MEEIEIIEWLVIISYVGLVIIVLLAGFKII